MPASLFEHIPPRSLQHNISRIDNRCLREQDAIFDIMGISLTLAGDLGMRTTGFRREGTCCAVLGDSSSLSPGHTAWQIHDENVPTKD